MGSGADLRECADDFVRSLGEQGYSARTRAFYRHDVRRVLGMLAPLLQPVRAEDWKARFGVAIDAIAEAAGSAATVARVVSACKRFERYCIERGALTEATARGIRTPAVVRSLPRALPRQVLERVLDDLAGGDVRDLRDRAVLEVMASLGIKVSELVGLRVRDVDCEARLVRVVGRGTQGQKVPVSARAAEAIREYVARAGHGQVLGAYLIAGQSLGPISIRTVQRLVHQRLRELATTAEVTPQHVRDSFAMWCLESGADVEEVSRVMGYRGKAEVRRFLAAVERR